LLITANILIHPMCYNPKYYGYNTLYISGLYVVKLFSSFLFLQITNILLHSEIFAELITTELTGFYGAKRSKNPVQ